MISNIPTWRDSELYSHQQNCQQENTTTDSKHNELIKSPLSPWTESSNKAPQNAGKIPVRVFHKMGNRLQVTAVHLIFHMYWQVTALPLTHICTWAFLCRTELQLQWEYLSSDQQELFFHPRSKHRCHQRALFQFKWPSLANFWARLQTTHIQGCAEKIIGCFFLWGGGEGIPCKSKYKRNVHIYPRKKVLQSSQNAKITCHYQPLSTSWYQFIQTALAPAWNVSVYRSRTQARGDYAEMPTDVVRVSYHGFWTLQ